MRTEAMLPQVRIPFSSKEGGEWRFAGLLLFSLALHALVLAWANGPARQLPSPQLLITATLRLVAAPATAHVSPAPAAAVPQESRAPKQSSLPRRPELPPASRSEPVASARPAPQEVRQPQPPSEHRPEPEAYGAARPTTGDATPVVARPDQQSLLGRYAQQLSRLLASHQEYPRLAAQRGWEGEVRLRLKVARQGNLLSVQVDRSSGHDILDQHALQLVDLASGLPPLPEGLEGSEISVIVPVNYRLKKSA
jgi:protein TonB